MGTTENARKTNPDWKIYFRVILFVSIVIIALISIRWFMSNIAAGATGTAQVIAPPTPIVVEKGSSPNVDVITRQVEMSCVGDGTVDYSIFDLIVSGGFRPYEFRLENMLYQVLGPFPVQKEGEPLRLKVYGGESILVKVWSYGSTDPDWTGMISVPLKDPFCASTQTPEASTTPTSTVTPTFTPTVPPDGTPSKATREPTDTPEAATFTPVVNPTATPGVNPSNTPGADPTSTPKIDSTSTPVVVPTDTPVIIPTDTEKPTVVPTPTPINTNPKECEDGTDNDGDGFTDYPGDPQCTRPGDPHEEK